MEKYVATTCFKLLIHEITQVFIDKPESLTQLGYKIGYALVEKIALDKSRVIEPLEIVKLICKDFYMSCFNKQMDNLKTNHKGVFVLTDNQFPLLGTFSSFSSADTSAKAQIYLKIVCGMMQGALDNLGLAASVQVDSSNLPLISYHIKANNSTLVGN